MKLKSILIIGLCCFLSCSKIGSGKKVDEEAELVESDVKVEIEPVLLAPSELSFLRNKGSYLTTIAACGSCHSNDGKPNSPLSGGQTLYDDLGEVVVPNITSDPKTGIGKWSIGDIKKAIRENIGKAGRLLSPEAHEGYRWLSDEDATAISIFLQSTEPRENEVEARIVSEFKTKKWGLFTRHPELKGYVPNLPENAVGYRGLYLASFVQNCSRCHSPEASSPDDKDYLNGFTGRVPLSEDKDSKDVPSIRYTEDGISAWNEVQLNDYLSGEFKSPVNCPTSFYSHMTETDKQAVVIFLRSLK